MSSNYPTALRSIFIATFIAALCALIIAFLYISSSDNVRYTQPFERRLVYTADDRFLSIDLKFQGLYIAGVTNNSIYLGHTNDPLIVSIADTTLSTIRHQSIKLTRPVSLRNARIEIDSPYFSIQDGNLPMLITGEMRNWDATQYYDYVPPFIQGLSLSRSRFVVQSVISAVDDDSKNVFCVVRTDTPSVEVSPVSLGPESEAYYMQAGNLTYNKSGNMVVYTSTYSNRFFVLDDHLELILKGNTLDTITSPRIRRKELSSGILALASPPAVVNNYSFSTGTRLYVNSNMMGANERRDQFDQASVIDVYDVCNGRYQYSFYIPDFMGYKMKSFRIMKNKLLGVFGSHLVVHRLDEQLYNKDFTDQ